MTPSPDTLDELRGSIEAFRDHVAMGRFENKLTLPGVLCELELNIACWLDMLDKAADDQEVTP